MKKKIVTLIITAALTATSTTAFAAGIPRETTPLNSTEEQVCIVENLCMVFRKKAFRRATLSIISE